MHKNGKYRFYEWEESSFTLPDEYILDQNSDLADALYVFYLAGGYEFFNVIESEYYSGNWLDFIGDLYREIVDDTYISKGKQFVVPLSDEQKLELADRGVPEVFVTDIK